MRGKRAVVSTARSTRSAMLGREARPPRSISHRSTSSATRDEKEEGSSTTRPSGDTSAWSLDPERPRRFAPEALPRHVVQVVGHSTHHKCRTELEAWLDPSAQPENLAIRSLVTVDGAPRYRAGVDTRPGALVMIDPGFAKAPLETVELLPITPRLGA